MSRFGLVPRLLDRRAVVTAPVGGSLAPTGPPVGARFSTGEDAYKLVGPSSAPPGAVVVTPGVNKVDTLTASNPAGTTFYLTAGTHTLSSNGAFTQVQAKPGNTYIGAPGAILDGQNSNRTAFSRVGTTPSPNVTIKFLEIKNFVALTDQFCINPDASSGWAYQGLNVHNCTGAAINPGPNSTLLDCWLHDNQQYGFSSFAPPVSSGAAPSVSNVTVAYCEVAANGNWMDEYATGGSGPLGSGSPTGNGRNGGCKFWDTSNIWVHHCWVHSNQHVGIWADTNNFDTIVEDNCIEDNYAEAFFYEISYNFTFRRNLVRRNAVFKGLNFATRVDDFPVAAVYISESGSDTTVGSGLPLSYIGGPTIADGNVFVDNWGDVTLWENADRFCNSPANTSNKVYKPLDIVGGVHASLGLCNIPTAKVLTINTTAGSTAFTVTAGGSLLITDEGRAVSGVAGPTKIAEPTGSNPANGFVSATSGNFDLPATSTVTGATLTIAAGGINASPGYDVCRWKTQNIRIRNNSFSVNAQAVAATYPIFVPAAVHVGKTAVLSNFGSTPSWSPYTGTVIQTAIVSSQNNLWSDNTYSGDRIWRPTDQSTTKTFAQWQASPYTQDAGSTWTPASATSPWGPSMGSANFGDTQASVTWAAPGHDGGSAVSGYEVKTYRASDNAVLFTDTVGNVTSFIRTGLTNGVGVYFKVAAINSVGTGTQSKASNTVTPAVGAGNISKRAVSSAATSATTTSFTVPVPSGVQAGDVMYAGICSRGGTGVTHSGPAGWTQIGTQQNGSTVNSISVWRKVASGSEPANYTWTLSAAFNCSGGIIALTGVNATPEDTTPVATFYATADATFPMTGITTTTANCWVLVFAACAGTTSTWTPPSGYNEQWDLGSTGSILSFSTCATAGPVATGATGTLTLGISQSVSNKVGIVVAVRSS